MFHRDELLKELRAEWSSRNDLSDESPVIPGYPLLSRHSDVTSDATYDPSEVAASLEELRGAQQIAKEPRSVRGLDNPVRLARWAQKLNVGIYFGGV
jgi:hypothetical protein